jgi:hypothetical protein
MEDVRTYVNNCEVGINTKANSFANSYLSHITRVSGDVRRNADIGGLVFFCMRQDEDMLANESSRVG